MKTIIAGSRHMPRDLDKIHQTVKNSGFQITEVVCGLARGADTWGKEWAEREGIPVSEFPADWNKFKKAAGPIRNKQMADYADALIVFIYPDSRGSRNMFDTMNKLGKPVWAIWCQK